MRSFIAGVLSAIALAVSRCMLGVGMIVAFAIGVGIYGGGIWLCFIGFDWAGQVAVQEPWIGYPIIAFLMLTLGVWVPALGFVVACPSALGISIFVFSLAEFVERIADRDRS